MPMDASLSIPIPLSREIEATQMPRALQAQSGQKGCPVAAIRERLRAAGLRPTRQRLHSVNAMELARPGLRRMYEASADDTVPARVSGTMEIDPNYYNPYSMAAAKKYVRDYFNHRGGRRTRNRKLSRRRRQSKRQRRSRKSRK